VKTLDLSGFDTSRVVDMSQMFFNCDSLVSLDISGWNTANVTRMDSTFLCALALFKVILGDTFVFQGEYSYLPYIYANPAYTGRWIREDKSYGPYSPDDLMHYYTPEMAGVWVLEKVPTEYSLTFVCTEEGYVGEMPSVMVDASSDYELPGNAFRVFGSEFQYWTDGTRRTWEDKAIIPANTYQANAEVVLTAVFAPRDTSIVMNNGAFEFSIKGDEKAFFDNVPAGTSYQVFEENLPEDWVLIAQSNTTGLIESLAESNAIFLNKYQPDMATMQFTGRKLMDEQPAIAGSFTFELWEGNILLQTKSVTDGGFVQFDMLEYDRNDVGIHTYIIKELVGSDETVLYDGH
jgi:surface protein